MAVPSCVVMRSVIVPEPGRLSVTGKRSAEPSPAVAVPMLATGVDSVIVPVAEEGVPSVALTGRRAWP